MRHVNLLTRFELHGPNLQHVARALVQQADDLFVKLVDGLAMFRNVHSAVGETMGTSGLSCQEASEETVAGVPEECSGGSFCALSGARSSLSCSGGTVANPGSAVR